MARRCRVGTIRLALGAGGSGVTAWSLRGIPATTGGSIDGLATRVAVQPGRRIATARRAAGLGTALAFMSPR